MNWKNQKKVEEDEIRGRKKMERLCRQRGNCIYEATPIRERYDGMLYYKGKRYVIEVKDRALKYVRYDTNMYECEKHHELKKVIKETHSDGGYYVTFIGDTAYIYQVNMAYIEDLPVEKRWCPATTSYDTEWVLKEVYLLPKKGKDKVHVYQLNDEARNY